MDEQALRAVVEQGLLDALAKRDPCRSCCASCELEPGQHRDDHQFIQACHGALQEGGKAMAATIGKGLLIVIGLGLLTLLGVKLGLGGK